jgi:hypothetical protein
MSKNDLKTEGGRKMDQIFDEVIKAMGRDPNALMPIIMYQLDLYENEKRYLDKDGSPLKLPAHMRRYVNMDKEKKAEYFEGGLDYSDDESEEDEDDKDVVDEKIKLMVKGEQIAAIEPKVIPLPPRSQD